MFFFYFNSIECCSVGKISLPKHDSMGFYSIKNQCLPKFSYRHTVTKVTRSILQNQLLPINVLSDESNDYNFIKIYNYFAVLCEFYFYIPI